jgi:hypothetical protein
MTVLYLYLDPSANSGGGGIRAKARGLAEGRPIEVLPFVDGQSAIAAAAQFARIERLVFFTHGSPWWVGRGSVGSGWGLRTSTAARGTDRRWRPLSEFCEVVGPKLASGTIIGLAACSCGLNPADSRDMARIRRERGLGESSLEDSDLIRIVHSTGGEQSFAAKMRDGFIRNGARNIEIRAHSYKGHMTTNPRIIVFSGSGTGDIGSPGVHLSRSRQDSSPPEGRAISNWDYNWQRSFAGRQAEEYIIGGDLPEGISLERSADTSYIYEPGSFTGSGRSGGASTIIPSSGGRTAEGPNAIYGPDEGEQRWETELPSRDEIRSGMSQWARETADRMSGAE